MIGKFVHGLLLIFIAAAANGQGMGSCDRSRVEACLAPYKNGPFDNMLVLSSAVSASALQTACGQLAGVSQCVLNSATGCTKYDLVMANDLVESVRFVCNEGNNGIRKFQECTTDPNKMQNYINSFYSCYSYVSSRVPDYNIYGQICKQENGVFSCYVNASRACDSMDFVMNYYKKFNSKMSLLYYCNLDNTNWNTTQAYSECHIGRLSSCVSSSMMDTSAIYPINVNFFTLSDSDLNRICSSHSSAIDCVKNQAKCSNELMAMPQYAGACNATNYLCNENRNGFNKVRQCVRNYPMAFSACLNIVIRDCNTINSQHNCMSQVAKTTCEDDAFVQNIYYYSIQPKLYPNCQLSLPLKNTSMMNDGMKCDVTKMQNTCIMNLKQLTSQIFPLNANLFTLSDYNMNNICNTYASAMECVKNLPSCDYELMNMPQIAGILNATNYLCNIDRNGLTKVKQCLVRYPMAFTLCLDIEPKDCSWINSQHNCMSSVAKETCGDESFIQNLYYYSVHTILPNNCQLVRSLKSPATTDVDVYCDVTKMQNTCIPDLNSVTRNYFPVNANFFTLTNNDLNKICSPYPSTMDCVMNQAKCEDEYKSIPKIAGLMNATNYLCNIDRIGFNKVMKCVQMNPRVFSICNNIAISDCRSIDSQHNCMAEAAKLSCGDDSFVRNMYLYSVQSILPPNCQLSLSFKDSTIAKAKCDNAVIEACIAPFSNGTFDNMNIVATPVNSSLLQKTCALLPGAKKCLMDASSSCSKFSVATATDLLESISYLCNEGNYGMRKFQNCFTDPAKYQNYNNTFYSCKSYVMGYFEPDVSIDGQTCKQKNGLFSCLVNASKICDSMDFAVNYYKKFNSRLRFTYYCNLDYSNWDTTQVYSECNKPKLLVTCTSNLMSMASQLIPLNSNLFRLSDSSFNEICSSYATAMDCAKNEAKCGADVSTMDQVAGLYNATNYMCNVDKIGYNKVMQCILKYPQVFSICLNIEVTECNSLNSQFNCLVSVAKATCADDSFIQNFYYYSIQPLLYANCKLSLMLKSPAISDGMNKCDTKTIETCIAPFKNGPFDNMNLFTTPVNASLLQRTCANFAGVSKCVSDASSGCSNIEMAKINDLVESIRYLCNEGNYGITKFQSCFSDPSKNQNYYNMYSSCNRDVFMAFMPDLSVNGQICKQSNGLFSCLVNASKLCDSMGFTETYYKKYNSRLGLIYGCSINYLNWNTTQVYGECNTKILQSTCVAPLISVTNQYFPINQNLFTMSDSTLNSICSTHAWAMDCAKNEAKCGADLMTIPQVAGLFNATNYICNLETYAFKNLKKCVAKNPDVFKNCFNIATTDCTSINSRQSCLIDVALNSCGDNSFMQNVYHYSIQPLLPQYCKLTCAPMHCNLLCGYGYKTDSYRCNICECVNPCANKGCPSNQICKVEDSSCTAPCVPVANCYPRNG